MIYLAPETKGTIILITQNHRLRRSTLGEENNGICGNRNNCRYKGTTVCWAIDVKEDGQWWPNGEMAKTKKAGIAAIEWCAENGVNGDPIWNFNCAH